MISGNLTAPGVCRRRLTWRSDSCHSCVGKYGEDLSGGFYEAGGSSLKYPSIISGFSGAMLAWAAIEFPDGFTNAGAMDDVKWKVKWAADHVISAHPQEFVFAGFIGNDTIDFDNWAPVEYWEKYAPPRAVGYVTKDDPGTEIVADAAATLAAAYTLLKDDDAEWAANAMTHARQLYDFGKTYPGSYSDSKDPAIKIMSDMYPSENGFNDDMAWAAVWMYKATGEQSFLTDANSYFSKIPAEEQGATFETGYKTPGVAILLAETDGNAQAMAASKKYFDSYLEGYIAHTKAGAAYPYHWGSNRHAGNLGFLTMVHAKNKKVDSAYAARLTNYGMHQTNYLLGDAGRSWVVGFGKDYPTMLNHKYSYYSILNWNPDPAQEKMGEKIWMTGSGGPWAPEAKDGYVMRAKFDFEGSRFPQSHTAWGTLFGGVLYDDGLINTRRDYTYAEPTVEYNAGAVGAVAALADWYGTGQYNGVESLDGVIPFTCDPPQIPFTLAPTPAPAPGPGPGPGPALAPAPAPLAPGPAPMTAPAPAPSTVAPAPGVVLSPPASPPPAPSSVIGGGGAGGGNSNSNSTATSGSVSTIKNSASFFAAAAAMFAAVFVAWLN